MTSIMTTSLSFTPPNSHFKQPKLLFPLRLHRSIPKFFREPQVSRLALGHKSINIATNVIPKIEPLNLSDNAPDVEFYKLEAILRPWRLLQVTLALMKMGVCGVTVSGVRGFGSQCGIKEWQRGPQFSEEDYLPKIKMEIVVSKGQRADRQRKRISQMLSVEEVINIIHQVAWTGEIGDGKIFVIPVLDVIRLRTGEHGETAVSRSLPRGSIYRIE